VWIMLGTPTRAFPKTPPGWVGFFFVLAIAVAVFGGFRQRRILREKLARELRLIACTPIPARGDKRFKK